VKTKLKKARLKAGLKKARILIVTVGSDDFANQAAAFEWAHRLSKSGMNVEVRFSEAEAA
jgi:hypothetical protein